MHGPAADRGERGQFDVATGEGLDLRPRGVAPRVLGHRGERRQGEQAAGAGRLEDARIIDAAGVGLERRQGELAAAAGLEVRAVGVGESAEARRAATQADCPDGERFNLADGKRAGAVEREVGLGECGQGAVADRAVIGHLESG